VIPIIVTSIIIGGLIALEVIYLRAVKIDKMSKSENQLVEDVKITKDQIIEMKSQLSKLELAMGYKNLKNQ
jgi:hypothetical protein